MNHHRITDSSVQLILTPVLSLVLLVSFNACHAPGERSDDTIRVGIFDQNGASPVNITDAIEALRIDPAISPRTFTAVDLLSGAADDIDVYLFPGGSGRFQTGNLGELGRQKINDRIKKKGKGVVGICAGAYALTETPDYPGLALSGAEAIDIEHDHRGHGLVKFSLTEEGQNIFPELKGREIHYSQYYEGPVLIPAEGSKYKYVKLATMLSDVHTVEGTPQGMTLNRPFIIITNVDEGRSASIVGHPESTPGMRWMVPRLVRYVAGRELVPYGERIVRPHLHTEEVLFTSDLLKKRQALYGELFKSKESG